MLIEWQTNNYQQRLFFCNKQREKIKGQSVNRGSPRKWQLKWSVQYSLDTSFSRVRYWMRILRRTSGCCGGSVNICSGMLSGSTSSSSSIAGMQAHTNISNTPMVLVFHTTSQFPIHFYYKNYAFSNVLLLLLNSFTVAFLKTWTFTSEFQFQNTFRPSSDLVTKQPNYFTLFSTVICNI